MPARACVINRRTNELYYMGGLMASDRLPDKERLRQKFSSHRTLDRRQLPPKVDLRAEMTPIENQAKSMSCVANALAGAYEYLLKKATSRHVDVSRLFIYYNARVKNKKQKRKIADKGCIIAFAIEALEESGTCLEELWPFELTQVNTRPDDDAFEAAANNTITDAMQLEPDLDEMKSCLAQGYPFVFGLKLVKSFSQAAKKGVVQMPQSGDEAAEIHSRHAMLAVGYSDRSKAFIVRNSWGEKWGDKGYCYIAYNYVANPEFLTDAWAIRQLESDDMGREHWDEEDAEDFDEDDDDNNEDDDDEYDVDFVEDEEEEDEGEDDEQEEEGENDEE